MKKIFVVLVSFLFVLSCSDKKNVETDIDSDLEYEIDIIDEIEEVDDDIAINENDDNTDVDLEPEFPLDGCRNEETEDKYQSFEVKKNGFLINGNFVLLRGGTIQYFRLPAGIINEGRNSLVLLFEDTSGGKSGEATDFKAGSIEELSIILNQEEKNGTSFKPITGVKGKLSF